MSQLTRASLSIEADLMARFDAFVAESGHQNRSEAMRDLIRARLLEDAWDTDAPTDAIATVTLLYNHEKRQLSQKIEQHGHEHHDVVRSSMHIHMSAHVCLEVVVLRGAAAEVKHVANHLVGLPGVLHGQAVFSRADLVEPAS